MLNSGGTGLVKTVSKSPCKDVPVKMIQLASNDPHARLIRQMLLTCKEMGDCLQCHSHLRRESVVNNTPFNPTKQASVTIVVMQLNPKDSRN